MGESKLRVLWRRGVNIFSVTVVEQLLAKPSWPINLIKKLALHVGCRHPLTLYPILASRYFSNFPSPKCNHPAVYIMSHQVRQRRLVAIGQYRNLFWIFLYTRSFDYFVLCSFDRKSRTSQVLCISCTNSFALTDAMFVLLFRYMQWHLIKYLLDFSNICYFWGLLH
jgi:hypothetical protein